MLKNKQSLTARMWFVSAMLVALTVGLSNEALAQSCPAGSFPCGVSHCVPTGRVCCASVGREDRHCPAGTTCTADGACNTNGGGGGTCPAGTTNCGANHCSPVDRQCCAFVGREDISCGAGAVCTASGCATGSGGDSCANNVTCDTCAASAGCGWCGSTGRCMSGTASGSTACGGGWAWITSDCRSGGGSSGSGVGARQGCSVSPHPTAGPARGLAAALFAGLLLVSVFGQRRKRLLLAVAGVGFAMTLITGCSNDATLDLPPPTVTSPPAHFRTASSAPVGAEPVEASVEAITLRWQRTLERLDKERRSATQFSNYPRSGNARGQGVPQ